MTKRPLGARVLTTSDKRAIVDPNKGMGSGGRASVRSNEGTPGVPGIARAAGQGSTANPVGFPSVRATGAIEGTVNALPKLTRSRRLRDAIQ